MREHYDAVIIGAGPGGFTAAIEAARAGLSVALVEKEQLGGTCLNRGCVPTKALLKSAEVIRTVKKAVEFGVNATVLGLDWPAAVQRKNAIVAQLAEGMEQSLSACKVEILHGEAEFISENAIKVQMLSEDQLLSPVTRTIEFGSCIIAAGSRPAQLKIPGTGLPSVLTSDDIMNIGQLPESMVIIGGGVVGMEMATIFNEFAVKVTVVEYLPQILNGVDGDIIKRFVPQLKKQGINIVTGAKVEQIIREEKATAVEYTDKTGCKRIVTELVLAATGRCPAGGLNLAAAAVEEAGGWIKTDHCCRTTNPAIYAVGDINGKGLLAHVAEHQAHLAVQTITDKRKTCTEVMEIIPAVIFTHPEIAGVGVAEEQARASGCSYITGKALFGANGKAVTAGQPEGLVKLIADRTSLQIIGAHILGADASSLIAELTLAITNKLTIDAIVHTIHAHPTLPEVIAAAARDVRSKLAGIAG